MDLVLPEDTFTITAPDGESHTIADPLQLLLDLCDGGLISTTGEVTANSKDAVEQIRHKILKASGISSLTIAQTLRVVVALSQFAGELQKKIASPPNSLPSTDTPPQAPPID
jgi:hypothetical protein